MARKLINPWTWQDQFGFVQANELSGIQRYLVCSGQTAVDANGSAEAAGDMAEQITKSFDNLETVLKQAGFSLSDVVRLNYYTTDLDAFFEAAQVASQRMAESGCRPASTLLGVSGLAFPNLLIEIEATAVA